MYLCKKNYNFSTTKYIYQKRNFNNSKKIDMMRHEFEPIIFYYFSTFNVCE